MTLKEFSESPHSKWVLPPDESIAIDVFFYGAMDCNYRFVQIRVPQEVQVSLQELLQKNVKDCPRPPHDQAIKKTDVTFSLKELEELLPPLGKQFPSTWDMSGYDSNVLEIWDHGIYGYGYWMFHNKKESSIRIFQWSQQHLSMHELDRILNREALGSPIRGKVKHKNISPDPA